MDPWIDSLKLAEVMPFQGDPMWRLRVNRGKRVAAMCTGVGAVRAASAVTTLLHDERWDVTESIWFLAGVAGVDPKAGSLGSAFFARYVIGGDITRYVDPREAPKTWPYAWASLGHSSNQTYRLNLSLVDKALRAATSAGALPDSAQKRNMRAPYSAYPKAVEAPAIHVGDELATMSFWVGEHAAEWARSWVAKWTDGESVFYHFRHGRSRRPSQSRGGRTKSTVSISGGKRRSSAHGERLRLPRRKHDDRRVRAWRESGGRQGCDRRHPHCGCGCSQCSALTVYCIISNYKKFSIRNLVQGFILASLFRLRCTLFNRTQDILECRK